ncbi:MAG: hypothetical protein Kow0068_14530 [Marinilabiliales bacterium]
MKFAFENNYAYWLIPVCLIFAAGIVYLLYNNYAHFLPLKKVQKYLIYSLRFLFVFIISFLLLSPLIEMSDRKIVEPVIVIAQDNSGSIVLNNDSNYYRNVYPVEIQQFINDISEKFRVETVEFGSNINDSISFNFNDKQTDFSKLFTFIEKKYFNKNLGAIILASDGIINYNQNPLFLIDEINVPVYTIALGDTTKKKDIKIADVKYNKSAILGNKFPVKIITDITDLKETNTVLSVFHKGEKIFEKKITALSDDFTDESMLEIEANEKGIQYYQISLKPSDDEITIANNKTVIAINIIDEKQKVLILSNAPHPDIAAIKSAIKTNQNLEVKYLNINDFNEDILSYNLIIMYQLPGKSRMSANILKQIYKHKLPVLYIIGTGTDISAFNNIQTGIKILQSNESFEETVPILNNSFELFKVDDFKDLFINTTPLISPFGDFNINPDLNVLLYQQIKGINTNKPLMVLSNSNGHKTGCLFGEGLWRWKLYDYLNNSTLEDFNIFINKILQYLSLQISKNKFVVDIKNIYNELDEIVIYAEVYNENYELINEQEVSFDLFLENNKKIHYTFDKAGNAYKLSIGHLAPGEYSYTANVIINKKKYTLDGKFTVIKVNTETINNVADHQLLKQISQKTNGKFYYPSELKELSMDIYNNENIVPVSFLQKSIKELINYKWLFFIIIAFAGFEWFLRKFYGSY